MLLLAAVAACRDRTDGLVPEPPRGIAQQLYDWIDFVTPDIGYVASDQVLLRTDDGGRTWRLLLRHPSPTQLHRNWLRDVVRADLNGILHSEDGGRTWTFVPDYFRRNFRPAALWHSLQRKLF